MRARVLVLSGVAVAVLAAGATALATRSAAERVQADLRAAQGLLATAATPSGTELTRRLALVDQAGTHITAARGRLERWPLGPLGAIPLLGRDLRVAEAVADAAEDTVAATRTVVTGLAPLESTGPDARTLARASTALASLAEALRSGTVRVQETKPLVATRAARAEFLRTGDDTARTAAAASEGLRVAATLYGPAGSARWFLGFQNPAELRGTGGLLGQYGILEASPTGPRLAHVGTYTELDERRGRHARLSKPVATRFARFGVQRSWSAVNIPPDLPTVGQIVSQLYAGSHAGRIDGVVLIDPLAVAEVLAVRGPITVDGMRLDAGNIADQTLVQAYVRFADDNEGRRRFLEKVAEATFAATQQALGERPMELARALAEAARSRHVQLWAADARAQRALISLGLGGSAAAPASGDYLMPVGVNAAGNKLDAFLHRRLRWDVTLGADGAAKANAKLTLRNAVPDRDLPQYIVGPYDARFELGEQRQFQSLYLAKGYGFTRATANGQPVKVESQPDVGAIVLSRYVSVPARKAVTLGYDVERDGAADLVDGRLRYRLLIRPQAVVNADRLELVVRAPTGWRVSAAPSGFTVHEGTASWAGELTAEKSLEFWMAPPG